jgi:transposase
MEALGVSLATIKRYVKQRRELGHVQPKAIPGRPPKKAARLDAELLPQLQAHDDLSLDQQCELWEQTHGEQVSPKTMDRAIKRLGWTRKKSHWVEAERREEERVQWREQGSQLEASQLVFLDECGSNIALTPLYARAPRG